MARSSGRGLDREAGRIEDSACRMALRQVKVPAGRVCREIGIDVADRLLFSHLRETLEFPAAPTVSPVILDPVAALLTRFERTNLWAAWVEAWSGRSDVHFNDRALIAKGLSWGTVAVVHGGPIYAEIPHLSLRSASRGPLLFVLAFPHWISSLGWSPGSEAANDEGEAYDSNTEGNYVEED